MLRLSLALVVLTLCACPSTPPCDPEVDFCDDAGSIPPDVCNSKAEALAGGDCALTLGVNKSGFLTPPLDGGAAADVDWYSAAMPANLTARSLLHVTGGYAAQNTAVNLALTLYKEDGITALERRIDKHGQAAPRPIDIILPFAESGTKVLLQVADEGASAKPNYDVRAPYSVKVEVLENPDLNEPNDTTPTVIPLTAMGAVMTGQAKGALATTNDVDRFSIAVPAARKIFYMHLSAPKQMPPPPYRLSYTVLNASGTPVAEGVTPNEFLAVDLATARLSNNAGNFTVVVRGYQSPNSTDPIPGDLKLQYTLDVSLFDDLDTQEPNDTTAAPKIAPLSVGGSTSFTGRLAYVPDPDIFAIDVNTASASTLHYRLVPSMTAGRFPPLAPIRDLQVRVLKAVTMGATLPDKQVACKTNSALCPKGYEGNVQAQGLVEGLCAASDPPLCLWSERNEESTFPNLQNLEGVIPVASGTNGRYFVIVQDDGNNYADDREYTLFVSLDADADEQTRAGLSAQTQTAALTEGSFPTPPAAGEVTGVVSHGYGRVLNNDVDRGQGVRGPNDYDAVPSDFDRFEFSYPGGLTTPLDRSWTLQWEVQHQVDGGGAPADLTLEVDFCVGGVTPTDGGTCSNVTRVIAYQPDRIQPWYGSSLTDRKELWSKNKGSGSTTINALPTGCFCFEPRFVTAGKFYVRVGAVDRVSNAPVQYKIRQGLAAYPQGFVSDAGGPMMCPAVPADGGSGCRFAGQ